MIEEFIASVSARASMNQRFVAFTGADKSPCITANFCKGVPYNVLVSGNKTKSPQFELGKVRRFTPEECERLQTLPVGYTAGVSDTQRYKSIGNGWTIDVIAHILSQIPQRLG
jgi:site-specific DNA-cytosine methylase